MTIRLIYIYISTLHMKYKILHIEVFSTKFT